MRASVTSDRIPVDDSEFSDFYFEITVTGQIEARVVRMFYESDATPLIEYSNMLYVICFTFSFILSYSIRFWLLEFT